MTSMTACGGRLALAAASLACIILTGCNLAPAYRAPVLTAPAAYKNDGDWTSAEPRDAVARGAWWTVFADPRLDALEAQVDADNPTLAGALAVYDQARALAAQAAALGGPTVQLTGTPTTNRQSDQRPLRGSGQPDTYAANTLGASFDYEIDFWGRVRNSLAAGRALAQASAADLATARLSLEAQMAQDYLALRGQDAQTKLLQKTIAGYERALQLTQARHVGGVASGLDVERASAQLSAVRAQLSDIAAARALFEDAIATLAGRPAPGFRIAPGPGPAVTPSLPAGLPASLLERRPDVAAAERRAFAANREIGVARAAFFPRVSLDALAGFQNTGGPNLISAPDSYWTLGPTLALTLIDGGRRHAVLAASRAAYAAAAADYRATALNAFREVQDGVSQQNDLAAEAAQLAATVASDQAATRITLIRYREGATNYLDVVTAQAAELSAEQAALSVSTRRQQTAVRLVQALGGGWRQSDLPTDKDASRLILAR